MKRLTTFIQSNIPFGFDGRQIVVATPLGWLNQWEKDQKDYEHEAIERLKVWQEQQRKTTDEPAKPVDMMKPVEPQKPARPEKPTHRDTMTKEERSQAAKKGWAKRKKNQPEPQNTLPGIEDFIKAGIPFDFDGDCIIVGGWREKFVQWGEEKYCNTFPNSTLCDNYNERQNEIIALESELRPPGLSSGASHFASLVIAKLKVDKTLFSALASVPGGIHWSSVAFGEEDSDTPALYFKNQIHLNPKFDWNTLDDYVSEKQDGKPWFSTQNKLHIIWHELGHNAFQRKNNQKFLQFNSKNIPLSDREKLIAENKVSLRASHSVVEYISEVYAGLNQGKKFSEDVLQFYHRYSGLEI